MKSTQRFLALVLCLVLCLALFPTSALAAGIVESGWANTAQTAEFVLYTDGRLVISGTGTIDPMNQWSFSSLGAGDYSSLNDAVLQTRSEIRSLTVEEGITSIGNSAFWNARILRLLACLSPLQRSGSRHFRTARAFWTLRSLPTSSEFRRMLLTAAPV